MLYTVLLLWFQDDGMRQGPWRKELELVFSIRAYKHTNSYVAISTTNQSQTQNLPHLPGDRSQGRSHFFGQIFVTPSGEQVE